MYFQKPRVDMICSQEQHNVSKGMRIYNVQAHKMSTMRAVHCNGQTFEEEDLCNSIPHFNI